MMMYYVRLALAASLLVGTSPIAVGQSVDRPAQSIEELSINGQQRIYALERFQTNTAHGRLPIIIYLHGLFGDVTKPEPLRFALPFDTLPNMEPALLVRPQGVDGKWNAPAERPNSRREFLRRLFGLAPAPADDVAFVRALINVLVEHDNGDPQRIYVAGISAGGYMAARLTCELGNVLTAVAIILATARLVTLKHCKDTRPIPVMLLASTTDPIVAYTGSDQNASVPDTVWFFKNRNGCKLRTEQPLPHLDDTINSTVSLIEFTECLNDADVFFYRVDGSGHSVPSKAPPEPGDWAASGARNRDIDTAQVVWDFFRNRRLPPP